MIFLYPLGLLGLIGIPVLIAVYIIKNKYTEQTIASTYLWRLSERFLRKRRPLSKLAGIVSLLLQIACIATLSLALAHPVLVLQGQAFEYCFILDGSGSMQTQEGETTRFAIAKENIKEVITNATNGSEYTLVFAGESTSLVFERITDREEALLLLDGVDCSYTVAKPTEALAYAQGRFNENPALRTYYLTDKNYEKTDGITFVKVGTAQDNYAVSALEYEFTQTGITVTGEAYSYENDAELTIALYLDENPSPIASTSVSTTRLQPTAFAFDVPNESFYALKAVVKNADALLWDNESVLYNIESENSYKTLLVSETPFFLQSALEAVGSAEIEVISPETYTEKSGYGLYIFDGYTPQSMPKDGAVWLINLDGSLAGAGYSVQGEVIFENAQTLSLATGTSSTIKTLTKNLQGDAISVSQYMKYGLYRNFTTLLSYKGQPVVFTGANEYGNREVVFAFSLHNSNFPLLTDYAVLMHNLWEYSFPDVLEDVYYDCGEVLTLRFLPNTETVRIDAPSGNVRWLSTGGSNQIVLDEVGVYEITMTVSGVPRYFHIYSALPETERFPTVTEADFSLQGEASANGFDGKYDELWILLIVLLLVFAADWVVYCYDKYQLR